jgi:hypothetical protein
MATVMDDPSFPTLVDAAYSQIVEQEEADVTDVISEIFTEMQGDRLDEYSGEIGEMAPWDEFLGQITYQQIYEQFNSHGRAREYATGCIITQRLIEDDLFGVMTGARFRPMVRAGLLARQLHAHRLFEMMGVVDTHYYTYSEGVPLVSTSHTTRTPGVSTAAGYSNRTNAALSDVSLQAALINGRKIKNDQGYRTGQTYDTLWVPPDLAPRAMQILATPWGLDNPYRNVNTESAKNSGIMNVNVLPHWSSTANWALTNSRKQKAACRWIVRRAPQFYRIREFDTIQMKNAGSMRHGYMVVMNGLYFIYGGIVS